MLVKFVLISGMPKENNQLGGQKRPHRDGKTDLIQSSILSLKVDVGLEYFHVFTQHAIGIGIL